MDYARVDREQKRVALAETLEHDRKNDKRLVLLATTAGNNIYLQMI